MTQARIRSIVLASGLTIVFFLFQNFSEFKIDPANYKYQILELKHLSETRAQSLAQGINSKGEVFGQSMGDDGFWHLVIWSPKGEVKDLGKIDSTSETKIHYTQPFTPKGIPIDFHTANQRQSCDGECRLSTGIPNSIPPLSAGTSVYPRSMNAQKHVVGWAPTKEKNGHAFLFRNGQTLDLGSAKGKHSSANDINDLGQIVGETLDSDNHLRPVLWSVVGEKISALDLMRTFKGPQEKYQGRANSINNTGTIVGSLRSESHSMPFLWTPEEGMKNLNQLSIDSDPLNLNRQWIIEDARAINNCGHIVTWGKKINGTAGHSLLLTRKIDQPGCS